MGSLIESLYRVRKKGFSQLKMMKTFREKDNYENKDKIAIEKLSETIE